jgi:hypothetical protein
MKNFIFSFTRARALAGWAVVLVLLGVSARADVVFAWNEALEGFFASSPGHFAPHLEARAYAIAHLAIDDGVREAARGASRAVPRLSAQRAAAATAARLVLGELLPAAAARIEALAVAQLAALPDDDEKKRGMELGRAAAAAVLSQRESDGWVSLVRLHPPFGPEPDRSRERAIALLAGGEPAPSPWLTAKPFALKGARQIHAAAPYVVRHDGQVQVDFTLRLAKHFKGVDRSAAAQALEREWSDGPVPTWNRIARDAAARAPVDLAAESRLLTVLNVALADATLSALHWRHELGTWRPTTVGVWHTMEGRPEMPGDEIVHAIVGLHTETVRRVSHTILLPPIPNYPSLAATLAGAAQGAIVGCLKNEREPLVLASGKRAVGEPARVFADVPAAARECMFVASFDGKHTRESCVAGYELGAAASKRVLAWRR